MAQRREASGPFVFSNDLETAMTFIRKVFRGTTRVLPIRKRLIWAASNQPSSIASFLDRAAFNLKKDSSPAIVDKIRGEYRRKELTGELHDILDSVEEFGIDVRRAKQASQLGHAFDRKRE